jgi:hypothetical protein
LTRRLTQSILRVNQVAMTSNKVSLVDQIW